MDHNDETTIGARIKGWEIFAPDWNHFRQLPTLPLSALCALSVGLTPFFADPDWVLFTALPHFDCTDPDEFFWSDLDDEHVNAYRAVLLKVFYQRTNLAVGNLVPMGVLPVAVGEPDSLRTLVRASDFIAWADSMGWGLPAEFSRTGMGWGLPAEFPRTGQQAPALTETIEPTTWQDIARTIAFEYIQRHKANNLFPTQKDVCAHAKEKMDERKIVGPQGRPLEANYIQRCAIQGEWWKSNKP